MTTTPTTTTTTPPSTPIIHGPVNFENLNESWCELQFKSGCSSTGSISHLHQSVNPEILEKLLQEALKDSQSPSPISKLQNLDFSCAYFKENTQNDTSTPILVDMDKSMGQISPILKLDSPPLFLDKTGIKPIACFECKQCLKHKKQIELLLSKQLEQEKQLSKLKKEYEEKLLTKSPEFILSSHSSISETSSVAQDQPESDKDEEDLNDETNDFSRSVKQNSFYLNSKENNNQHNIPILNTIKRQNSSTNTLVSSLKKDDLSENLMGNYYIAGYSSGIFNYTKTNGTNLISVDNNNNNNNNNNNLNNNNTNDWSKYFSSRPQKQPPKEWNFVHPNSSKSKLNSMNKMQSEEENKNYIVSKSLTKDNIGKLIFTHMASFIVGATLMFLVFKRHMNMGGSIYFV